MKAKNLPVFTYCAADEKGWPCCTATAVEKTDILLAIDRIKQPPFDREKIARCLLGILAPRVKAPGKIIVYWRDEAHETYIRYRRKTGTMKQEK